LIDPVLPAFQAVLGTVQFKPQHIALVSNVTGEFAGPEIGHPDYWLAHMRAPVRFFGAINTLVAQGITHFIEMGPHPVLLGMAAACVPKTDLAWLPSLRRDRAAWPDLLESVQRLYIDGVDIDWNGFDHDYQRRRIALPTYPFRRRRYWMDLDGQAAATPPPASTAACWMRIERAVSRQASQGPLDLNASSYPSKWECLDRLISAHAIRTLREDGVFGQRGEAHTLDGVLTSMGVRTPYRRLMRRWLDALVVRGVLRAEGDSYIADTPLPDPELPALWTEAEGLFADNQPLLDYVRHCGDLVGAVLRGVESPLETLFPHGSFELAEALYERSATMRYMNGLASAAVESFAEAWPAGRRLRVLEIGAGTGGTTSALLPYLSADRTRYLFTDVSDVFLGRARERFGAHPHVTYGLLDIDQDVIAQGYSSASADVIVAANVVHASADLPNALRRLRDLLMPGGVLILIESTTHFAWFDMTTGLIEGWQHFADDLREEQPLLSATTWLTVLGDAGFEAARAWPDPDSPASHLGQHLLVARVAGDAMPIAETGTAFAFDLHETLSPQVPTAAATDAVRTRILDALPGERMDLVRDFVRQHVMRVLRRDPADPPDRNDRLMDLGLDSLMSVQIRNEMAKGLGLDGKLPPSLMFDYPTIEKLAAYLLDRLVPRRPEEPAGLPAAVATPAPLGAAAVAAMTDAEIEILLSRHLEQRPSLEQTDVFSRST
jgi:SAM-dependent methyltransferase